MMIDKQQPNMHRMNTPLEAGIACSTLISWANNRVRRALRGYCDCRVGDLIVFEKVDDT